MYPEVHRNKSAAYLGPEKPCPLCDAGVPKRVFVPVRDQRTGECFMISMSQAVYDKIVDQTGSPIRGEFVLQEGLNNA